MGEKASDIIRDAGQLAEIVLAIIVLPAVIRTTSELVGGGPVWAYLITILAIIALSAKAAVTIIAIVERYS